MPDLRHLKPKDYRQAPWKNGRGVTSEIAVYPEGATLEALDFDWRLSTARIEEPGSFSRFPGYERFLTVWGGKGILLKLPPASPEKLVIGGVSRFSGDQDASAELVSGAVTDLNLIFNPKRVRADFKVFQFNKKPRSLSFGGKAALLFAIEGKFKLSVYLPEMGEQLVSLLKGETLRVDQASGQEALVLIEPKSDLGAGVLAAVELT